MIGFPSRRAVDMFFSDDGHIVTTGGHDTRKHLFWLDTETWGRGEWAYPMEIGWVITDVDYNPVEHGIESHVVTQPLALPLNLLFPAHRENGLYSESAPYHGSGENLDDVLNMLVDARDKELELGYNLVLAGNDVGFDMTVIEKYIPDFFNGFDHRTFDVSTLGEAMSQWVPEMSDSAPLFETNHRTTNSIRSSIRQARYYSGFVKNMFEYIKESSSDADYRASHDEMSLEWASHGDASLELTI